MKHVTISKDYTTSQKRRMLVDAVNLCYKTGTDASAFVGRPLSFYNFNKVLELIKEMNEENIQQGGDDFFEYQTNYPHSY